MQLESRQAIDPSPTLEASQPADALRITCANGWQCARRRPSPSEGETRFRFKGHAPGGGWARSVKQAAHPRVRSSPCPPGLKCLPQRPKPQKDQMSCPPQENAYHPRTDRPKQQAVATPNAVAVPTTTSTSGRPGSTRWRPTAIPGRQSGSPRTALHHPRRRPEDPGGRQFVVMSRPDDGWHRSSMARASGRTKIMGPFYGRTLSCRSRDPA